MTITDGKIRINSNLIREVKKLYKKTTLDSKKIKRLNLLCGVIASINQLLIRVRSKKELFSKVCKILTEMKDYKLAWIGLIDEKSSTVIPVAYSGFEYNYLSNIKIKYNKTKYGMGPTGTCIRTGKPFVAKDIEKNPGFEPWREEALKRGYHSSVAIPLKLKSKIIGALNIYSERKDTFDQPEIKFLKEVAGDITVGISRLESEEKLLKSEKRFTDLVRQLPITIFEIDPKGNITFANKQAIYDFDYKIEDFYKGLNVFNITAPKEHQKVKNCIKKLQKGKNINLLECIYIRKNGSSFPAIISLNSIRDKNKNIIGFREILVNISKEKKLLKKLTESEKKYQAIFKNTGTATVIIEEDKKISLVNSMFEKLTGYKRSEIENKKKWTEFLVEEDLKKMMKHYKLRRISSNKVPISYNLRLINRNNEIKDINLTISMIPGTKKSVASFLDITDHLKTSKELAQSYDKLKKTLGATIEMVEAIIETRDFYTYGHQKRVAKIADAIAHEMEFPEERIEALKLAASIHDLGKINTPAEILSKPDKLTDAEFSIIKRHPKIGFDIIKKLDYPLPIADIILQHHERINGSGYPRGLEDEDILTESKILAVADTIEAMASHRPYREALGIDVALKEIKKYSGIHYDPKVVSACLNVFQKKDLKLI